MFRVSLLFKLTTLSCILILSTESRGGNILFFNQDCNADIAGADNSCQDERANLLGLLQSTDNKIITLSSFSDANLSSLLSANDALVIPDIEDRFGGCDVTDLSFLPNSAKTAIADYVTNGGNLVVAGSTQNITFLNSVFSLNLTAAGNTSTSVSIKDEAEAADTPFESCPSTLPNLSATFLVTSSMPSNKKCIYTTGGLGSVAYFPIGSGGVVYLGYDFNDSGTGCTQEGSAWITCVLPSTEIVIDTGIVSVPIPTLGQWALIILGLLTLTMGIVIIRSHNTTLAHTPKL